MTTRDALAIVAGGQHKGFDTATGGHAMKRNRKLYQRLDELERQYAALLQQELAAVLAGGFGNYLGRKLRDDWDVAVGRRHRPDPRADELDDLEAEIRRLRQKLNEPLPRPAVGVAETLVARIKEAGEWSPACNKRWIEDAIAELADLM